MGMILLQVYYKGYIAVTIEKSLKRKPFVFQDYYKISSYNTFLSKTKGLSMMKLTISHGRHFSKQVH